MSKPAVFNSFDDLVWAVALSMPDEYPSGMAAVLAQDLIDKGKAVIESPESEEINGPA